ncbi:DGQHR domain-containing protein [Sabulibacter ruber]|uniref:DGQHR domain-containing protein n=1 Tax=Sabulibacter ruber TaxID=2811901 RepID=UPI001A976948|nr:DGQHR domain-containing protein [Sabulibacter ruber]
MIKGIISKKPKTKKKPLTAEEKKRKAAEAKLKKEQKKYINQIRSIFSDAGFSRINSDDIEINFKGRSGEIDDLFLYENVLIVCEQTNGKKVGKHLMNKLYLYNEIVDNNSDFIDLVETTYKEFKSIKNTSYTNEHYKVIVLYCSKNSIPEEHKKLLSNKIKFLEYHILHYLLAITSTIKLSSRFEVLNFLGLNYNEIGENILTASLSSGNEYPGTILPESHSSFSKGYKVVTFYIDPEALISRAYVLRKDGWVDGGVLYQRALDKKKVTSMRNYLNEEKRVFVNNVIATFSEDTRFVGADRKTIEVDKITKTSPVLISLPNTFNSICIIDGQHRLYAYHEREDSLESEIKSLRKRQNLLVTAIYYPQGTTQKERAKFEAKLFLEINDKQTKTKPDLRQAIELITDPYSGTAIAKELINRFAKSGPLENLIELYSYDKGKVKTASIVSYGLKPLVKFSGSDSLYSVWTNPNKTKLLDRSDDNVLTEYIDYCATEINKIFAAFRKAIDKERWKTNGDGVVKITVINGFIAALKSLIENNKLDDITNYANKLKGINSFKFENYKSSHWAELGNDLYDQYFSK